MHSIKRTTEIHCPFSAAVELAEQWLSTGSMVLRIGIGSRFVPLQRVSARTVTLDDVTDTARRHSALAAQLLPERRSMFPAFRIVATVRPWQTASRITVTATYDPPLGWLGPFVDALVLRRIASIVLAGFVADLRVAVESAWQTQRDDWLQPDARGSA